MYSGMAHFLKLSLTLQVLSGFFFIKFSKLRAVHLGVVVIIQQLCIVNKLTTCYRHTQTIRSLHWWQFVVFRL